MHVIFSADGRPEQIITGTADTTGADVVPAGLAGTPVERLRKVDGAVVAVDLTIAELMSALRTERDKRLVSATAVLDRHRNQRDFGLPTTLTDAEAIAWARYAQDLRDLPEQTADPANPVWPVAPDAVA